MADQTVTLPITPGKIQTAIETIVEQTFPRPREELCIPVGEMERRLAVFVGELVQAAYNDAGTDVARYQREDHDAANDADRRLQLLRDTHQALSLANRTPEVASVLNTIYAETSWSPWLAEQTEKVSRD